MARKHANPSKKATIAAAAALMLATASGPSLAAAQPAHGFGYIPPAIVGCPSNVKVEMQASSQSGGWRSGHLSVDGRVTVLNGETFTVPVYEVSVMVFPSNSVVAPVNAKCRGMGPNTRVPSSPIPYEYGRSSCTFEARLPTKGSSTGAQNWQQARAVVTLTNGAQCHSDMTYVDYQGDGGGGIGPLIGGASSRPMVGNGNRKMLSLEPRRPVSIIIGNSGEGSGGARKMLSVDDGIDMDDRTGLIIADDLAEAVFDNDFDNDADENDDNDGGKRKMLSFDNDDDDDHNDNDDDNDNYRDNDSDRDDNDDDDDNDGNKRKMLSFDDDGFDGDDNDDNVNGRDGDNDDDDNDGGKRKMLSVEDDGNVVNRPARLVFI